VIKYISGKIKKISKHSFVKNVAMVSSGVVVAQLLSILSSPVVSRLFTPENFGVFAILLSTVNILSLITSLAYENAIVLPSKRNSALNLVWLSILLLIIITILISGIVFIFHDDIAKLSNSQVDDYWVFMIPPLVFLKGFIKIINNWATREKKFKNLAINNVIRSSVDISTKILFGLFIGSFTIGLIGSTFIGMFVSVLYLIYFIFDKGAISYFVKVKTGPVKEVAKEYKKFPLYSSWNQLLNAASKELIVFFLSYFFTPAIVGLYHFSMKVLKQPISFISDSVGRVYYQKAASQYSSKENLSVGLRQTTFGLLAMGIIPFSIIAFFGQEIFAFVFGNEWANAGIYAQILTPWLFFLFINRPAMMIYRVFQKLDILLIYVILLTVSRALAIYSGYLFFNDPKWSMALFSFVGVIFNIYLIASAFYMVWSNSKLVKNI
jgi:lipopolysaccharide exporter